MRVFVSVVLVSVGSLSGCLLADDPDPPKCASGFHPENQHCAPDTVTETRVTITAAARGTPCTGDAASQRPPVVTPEALHVKLDELFQFENADVMDHEVRGADGKVWVSVPAGQRSLMTSITKVGTWAYRVSGCAKGGAIVVE